MSQLATVLCVSLAAATTLGSAAAAAELTAEKTDRGVTVKVDGKLFTEYLLKSGAKPILYPVLGPTGKPMTRDFPMKKGTPGERADHPHHRSFWFTHGDVNGTSFWHEGAGGGHINHREFVQVAGGRQAVIVTRNDWVDAQGKKQCEDLTRITFSAGEDSRTIDYEITITAAPSSVKFGDTKEGTFGVRVAGDMKATSKKGGRIINSEGQTDGGTWGKPAAWVDYHGPVGGERLGIAILNHPTSFRFPTHWHVRTYGLFAANPFGLHDFPGGKDADGSHTLQPGESLTFRYRVLLHKGDEKQGRVAEAFAAYAKEKPPQAGK